MQRSYAGTACIAELRRKGAPSGGVPDNRLRKALNGEGDPDLIRTVRAAG